MAGYPGRCGAGCTENLETGKIIVRLGIIGCGWVAEAVHLPVLSRLPQVSVEALGDVAEERLRLLGGRFGIGRRHRDWQTLLAEPELDAVLVATPGDTHAEIVTAALDAKKHVLVEKPLALTVADAQALAERARGARVTSMVGLNYRFHPLAAELKAAIDRGAVGRPLAIFASMTSRANQKISVTGYERNPARGGGVFHDKVVHSVDLMRFLLGSEVADGIARVRSESHEHDLATIDLEFENGAVACGVFCDRAVPDHSYVVVGDAGRAAINLNRPSGIALYRQEFSRGRWTKLAAYARQAPRRFASAARAAGERGRLSGYEREWRHFLASVESGSPAVPSFEDGLAVTRVVARLLDSLVDRAR